MYYIKGLIRYKNTAFSLNYSTDISPRCSKVSRVLQLCSTAFLIIEISEFNRLITWLLSFKSYESCQGFSSVQSLSHVWLFTTPWTATYQAPPCMGFSRQEYWSGVPLPSRVTLFIKLYIWSTASSLVISVEGSVIYLVIQEIIILWNKQNINGVVNNISGIKSKYFIHDPPTPIFI